MVPAVEENAHGELIADSIHFVWQTEHVLALKALHPLTATVQIAVFLVRTTSNAGMNLLARTIWHARVTWDTHRHPIVE